MDRSLLDDDPLTPTVTTGSGDHLRPVILLLCTDGEALGADLRRRFGADYEIAVATARRPSTPPTSRSRW
jgi:hypothetical protein